MAINKCLLTGRITRDSELRQTQSGAAVLSFSVAVNERVRNGRTDEWEDRANYVDCVLWGKRAEALSQHLVKGLKVAIEGRLRYSSWEDKNGGKRSKLEVIVDEIEFMSARQDGGHGQGRQQGGGYQQQPQRQQQQRQGADLYDEDLPF